MKKLALGRTGAITLLDDEDYDRVKDHGCWSLSVVRTKSHVYRYAAIRRPHGTLYLHRVVLDAPKGLVVDHINGDGLDNRRANLRLCTHGENMANRRKFAAASSPFRGVRWRKAEQKWAANIRGRCIGLFDSEMEAAAAVDECARAEIGEFATFNFPRQGEQAARPAG